MKPDNILPAYLPYHLILEHRPFATIQPRRLAASFIPSFHWIRPTPATKHRLSLGTAVILPN